MAVKRWSPPAAPAPAAFYSHLAEAPAGARIIAMAGQIGNRLDGGLPESVDDQLELAIANVLTLAAAAGGGGEADILKLVVFLTERPSDNARVGRIFRAAFPGEPPAMTWLYVAGLFRPEVKVEIDATLAVMTGEIQAFDREPAQRNG